MRNHIHLLAFAFLVSFAIMSGPQTALAASAAEIDRQADLALEKLYAKVPVAKELSKEAAGVLVFPNIVKAGLVFGGAYGQGALRKDGKTVAYYNVVEGSYGLQIGAQSFCFALFFMKDSALEYLQKSAGWEIGVGPTVVLVDEGLSKTLTTTTAKADVYAFFAGQQGLMAGLGLKGSKITKINPK